MKTLHKIMKAKKQRKDYEKKRNIIRAAKKTKKVVKDSKTNEPRWRNPRVQLPKTRKYKPGTTPLV